MAHLPLPDLSNENNGTQLRRGLTHLKVEIAIHKKEFRRFFVTMGHRAKTMEDSLQSDADCNRCTPLFGIWTPRQMDCAPGYRASGGLAKLSPVQGQPSRTLEGILRCNLPNHHPMLCDHRDNLHPLLGREDGVPEANQLWTFADRISQSTAVHIVLRPPVLQIPPPSHPRAQLSTLCSPPGVADPPPSSCPVEPL